MKTLFIIYDNGSYLHWFPQNVLYLIESVLNTDVTVYNMSMHHYSTEELKRLINLLPYDFICLGFIGGYWQYKKAKEISEVVNESKFRWKTKYILGGHGPSADPKFFLSKLKADIVVKGSGEESLRQISHGRDLSEIPGISYYDNGEYFDNDGNLECDIDHFHVGSYRYFNIEYYRMLRVPNCDTTDFVMPVLSARGCPYKCNFCYRMEEGYKLRDLDSVKDEIEFLMRNYRINYIVFSDELLMSSISRVEEVCKMVKPLNIKWNCNGRLNIAARSRSLLKLMRDSGCVFINYGVESFDDNALRLMNKRLVCKQIVRGVENTKGAGISPGLNIIFGNHGETKDTLYKSVKFLLDYDDHSQLRTIRPVTPYPGSELFDDAVRYGLIKDTEDFYENKHLNSDLLTCNFTDLTDEYFYYHLRKANRTLLRKYFKVKEESMMDQIDELYCKQDKSFRGFRQT